MKIEKNEISILENYLSQIDLEVEPIQVVNEKEGFEYNYTSDDVIYIQYVGIKPGFEKTFNIITFISNNTDSLPTNIYKVSSFNDKNKYEINKIYKLTFAEKNNKPIRLISNVAPIELDRLTESNGQFENRKTSILIDRTLRVFTLFGLTAFFGFSNAHLINKKLIFKESLFVLYLAKHFAILNAKGNTDCEKTYSRVCDFMSDIKTDIILPSFVKNDSTKEGIKLKKSTTSLSGWGSAAIPTRVTDEALEHFNYALSKHEIKNNAEIITNNIRELSYHLYDLNKFTYDSKMTDESVMFRDYLLPDYFKLAKDIIFENFNNAYQLTRKANTFLQLVMHLGTNEKMWQEEKRYFNDIVYKLWPTATPRGIGYINERTREAITAVESYLKNKIANKYKNILLYSTALFKVQNDEFGIGVHSKYIPPLLKNKINVDAFDSNKFNDIPTATTFRIENDSEYHTLFFVDKLLNDDLSFRKVSDAIIQAAAFAIEKGLNIISIPNNQAGEIISVASFQSEIQKRLNDICSYEEPTFNYVYKENDELFDYIMKVFKNSNKLYPLTNFNIRKFTNHPYFISTLISQDVSYLTLHIRELAKKFDEFNLSFID